MNRLAIIDRLFAIDALRFGTFTLKSGMQSPYYIDLRLMISYPDLLRHIGDALWEKAQNLSFNLICGVPYTALPLASYLSTEYQIPMIMKRKEVKTYGRKRIIEGMYEVGQTCLIIEDIITSGSSIFETKVALEEAKLKTQDALVVIDREQGGREILENASVNVHSLFTISEILDYLQNEGKIDLEMVHDVRQFIQENQCSQTS